MYDRSLKGAKNHLEAIVKVPAFEWMNYFDFPRVSAGEGGVAERLEFQRQPGKERTMSSLVCASNPAVPLVDLLSTSRFDQTLTPGKAARYELLIFRWRQNGGLYKRAVK